MKGADYMEVWHVLGRNRPGGGLVVSVPGADESGASAFERIFDLANAELVAMVEGAITAEERRRMALNVWPRRMSDLVAPFAVGGRFQSLVLKATETCLLSDSAWACYEKDGDADALANKHMMFFRAVFAPTLASFLDAVRAGEPRASLAFADCLTSGLKSQIANEPSHINSLVQIIRRYQGTVNGKLYSRRLYALPAQSQTSQVL